MARSRCLVRLLLVLFVFGASLRAAWKIEPDEYPTLSPDGALVLVVDDSGFVAHDARTLQPRFVVRQPEARPRMFSDDGKRLYYTILNEGLFALDLESGSISTLARIPFIHALLVDSDTDNLITVSSAPNGWECTTLRVHRAKPGDAAGPSLIAEIPARGLPWIELVKVFPAREAGHALLLMREAGKSDDEFDPRKFGDFHFVDLSLADGALTPVSTLAAPRDGFYFDRSIRWATAKRDLLEYASGAYLLIDPYSGKIVRELRVPRVEFSAGEPGQIIAAREADENGSTRHYRDYLESGTLKTIRNVPLPAPGTWPERPAQKLPDGHRLVTPPGADAVSLAQSYGQPYRLRRLNSESGEISATYEAGGGQAYSFANYAFHPGRPEFFAMDSEENVHFFRVAPSGLKHQFRGQSAYWAAYSPAGETVFFHGMVDSPTGQATADGFPARDAIAYDDPPMVTTDPVEVLPPVLSPSGRWIVTINNRDATLHRFGEAPIVATLGGVLGGRMPLYRFAPDESRLARLVTRVEEDDDGVEKISRALELLSFPLVADYPDPRWSVALPHADFAWLDYAKNGVLRFLDLRSGELRLIDDRQGESRSVAVAGLDAAIFGDNEAEPVGPVWDAAHERAFVALGDKLLAIDFVDARPRASVFKLPGEARRLHRYGDGRHLVAELRTGSLAFIQTRGETLRLALTLDFYAGGQGAYLASTPAGRFDASPAIRESGYLLKGTRPVPLAQVFDRDYQPDLLTAALGADAVGREEELAAFVQPPTVELSGLSLGGLRHRFFIDARSQQYPLAEVALYQNEKLVLNFPIESGRMGLQARHEIDLLLEDNRFKLVATDTQGVSVTSAEVVASPPEALLREKLAAERPAELHLLAVGVNQYRNSEYNLNFAVADAEGVAAKIQAANRALFAKVNVHRLDDARATRDGILAAFERVRAEARPQDAFIFYFAGHGVMAKSDASFYLVPHDVTRIYGDSQSLSENGLSAQKLRDLSASIAAQKQLFILDACNSGGALQAFAQRGASQEKAIAQLARATGTHWIAASSSTQFATEFKDLGHGAFTHTLLRALDGEADTGDKRVTINELKAFLEAELPAVTQRHKGAPQYPSSYGQGQDFPVALLP